MLPSDFHPSPRRFSCPALKEIERRESDLGASDLDVRRCRVIDEIACELVDSMGSGFKLLPKEPDPAWQADAAE